ncbi:hypothetical protein COY90_04445 [Candidatus Roizmanbacteria bacterium CG_4_10_14_0_8_um_filter_39_9]|uniref:DUF6922 domain-containing protein n=1 Tax=Candidatus Roizmanbacteria bacterium CG_4_10_14_0_8_um_filter_39_9 TaxID=1974829 RepID=A0A2M7QBX9_9BACT|nr:MAG: hypothetical protein COY90_04445 [Candidatus Roizmanbacteria bacterium CG_4_10_14_0_8_um_filter_39_9]
MDIPQSLHHFFWDVEVEKLDPEKKPYFVINRLLDKGNVEAVKWVRKNYTDKTIESAITTLRDFSPKVARFWALYLKIPEKDVVCLQQPYRKMRKMHWPY